MDVLRVMDAFCASCDDIQAHAVPSIDPSSCYCNTCGQSQVLMAPVDVAVAA